MNTCFDDEQVDGRPRVAILITDGKSTDPQLTLEMADKLSKTPIKVSGIYKFLISIVFIYVKL